jgi:uncharacterized membrane protein YsdA (DUF1294 family)
MNPRSQPHRRRPRRLSIPALISLVALLLFPSLVILRASRLFDGRIIAAYLLAIWGLSFWLYWRDKRNAENGTWRTPEFTLHLTELFGGWPAAFLAQRIFRHKISKTSYQVAFWTIIVFHEVVAFDLVSDCQYSKALLGLLNR